MADTAVSGNGASTLDDLFALSDEQILDIDAEPVDIEIGDVYLDEADHAVLVPAVPEDGDRAAAAARESRASADNAANNPTREIVVDPAAPPQWLADRMSDPQ
ncbi:MAG TPA: hypothetical protein VGJ06_00185, partial [Candidatus Acidoferrum sp.]